MEEERKEDAKVLKQRKECEDKSKEITWKQTEEKRKECEDKSILKTLKQMEGERKRRYKSM